MDSLPYVAPLLEWDQRRVPHVVVTADGEGADVTTFDADHHNETRTYTNGIHGLVDAIVDQARSIRARLIVVAGEPQYRQPLLEGVATHVPVTCRVVGEEPAPAADLADTVVRLVSDTIARTTVEHLRDYRFLRTHEAAADGVDATVNALIDGSAELVLIHDDPDDQRRLWVGTGPGELSFDLVDGYTQARLNDAIIRSAVLQDIEVYIIPSTGVTGPEEDTGAFTG